jgi:hypothetical protein
VKIATSINLSGTVVRAIRLPTKTTVDTPPTDNARKISEIKVVGWESMGNKPSVWKIPWLHQNEKLRPLDSHVGGVNYVLQNITQISVGGAA